MLHALVVLDLGGDWDGQRLTTVSIVTSRELAGPANNSEDSLCVQCLVTAQLTQGPKTFPKTTHISICCHKAFSPVPDRSGGTGVGRRVCWRFSLAAQSSRCQERADDGEAETSLNTNTECFVT